MKSISLRRTLPQYSDLLTTTFSLSSCGQLTRGRQVYKRGVSQSAVEVPRYVKQPTVSSSSTGTVRRPLHNVGTGHLLRTLFLGYSFASPRLLAASMKLMKWITNSKSAFLNPDKNILLRAIVRRLIYDHFCAGTTPTEVKRKVAEIKDAGFSGVILGFCREIIVDDYEAKEGVKSSAAAEEKCIAEWLQGNLDTLNLIESGDFMNIKYTGAGPTIGDALLKGENPPEGLIKALDTICEQARSQGKKVWIDAEQQAFQPAIDKWTIDLMRRYNTGSEAVVYNTIQAYLKASRENILRHLKLSKAEGWVCGIKLVRGAYISSDIRDRIWDTKSQTDDNYNSIVRDILSKSFGPFTKESFPPVELFVAGHNKESIHRASEVVWDLVSQGRELRPVLYGQLQGMADEVSFDLVQKKQEASDHAGLSEEESRVREQTAPRPYKCLAWGSVNDCITFLMRRAVENATAADRLQDGVNEAKAELKRRLIPWQSG